MNVFEIDKIIEAESTEPSSMFNRQLTSSLKLFYEDD